MFESPELRAGKNAMYPEEAHERKNSEARPEPRRVDYLGLVDLWGAEAAPHMLRAVERAYRDQPPRPFPARDKSH